MTMPSSLVYAATGVRRTPWGVWLLALGAAAALTAFAFYGRYPPGDVTLARAMQDVGFPGLGVLSETLYLSGVVPAFPLIGIAAAAAMFWRRHTLLGGFMLLAVVSRQLVFFLKELVERPRPSPFLVDVSEQANGFSFPSGHVLGAVVLWGFLYFASAQCIASARARRWVQCSSLAIIVLMGFQRVYAGAHWPSDVLGAYLWGGVILFALVQAYKFCQRRQQPAQDFTPPER